MSTSKKTDKNVKRLPKVPKRLVDNGAPPEYFRNGFNERVAKTVFPQQPHSTDTLPQDQHAESSSSNSDPEDSPHPSDTSVTSGFGQGAHTNQYQGQPSDTQSALNFQSVQPSDIPPMIHNGVHSAGQATTPAFPPVLLAHDLYGGNSNTSQPRNTESNFDSFDAERLWQVHPHGQPFRCPWLGAAFNTSYGMGFTEYGHRMEAQHNVTAQGYSPGNQVHQIHRTAYHHPGAQRYDPPMYNTPDHIDPSVVGGSYFPPPHSTGSGFDEYNGYDDTTTD